MKIDGNKINIAVIQLYWENYAPISFSLSKFVCG